MHLDLENKTDIIIENELIDKLRFAKNIVLFGAGQTGDYFFEILKQYGINIKCYIDNYKSKQNTLRNGIMVYSFVEAIEKYQDPIICITSVYEEEIYAQIGQYSKDLLENTYKVNSALIWEIFEKKYISNEVNYICKNINSFNQLYTLLYDEESKSVLENLLNYRLTRMSKYLKPYCNRQKDLYFDEEIIGKDINVYIDGGVFDGETVKRYIDYVNGNYSKIYCFEAEPESINRTKTFINVNGVKNIELIENALWDQKAALRFKLSGAGGSRVIGQGDNSIEVQAISLDSLCLDKCDFIKLDIEGAEEKALIGMKDTIQRLHPNLAISVYHKQDDLINISRIVRKMYPQYKLYLRQYISAPVDTVLYAII